MPVGTTLPAHVSLRPDDLLAKKLTSRETPVNNLLCRVVLPKRTGRKRKRGSNDPFTHVESPSATENESMGESAPLPLDGLQLLQRLKEDGHDYRLEPVGLINEAHRFRCTYNAVCSLCVKLNYLALPDFQMAASRMPLMASISKHLLKPNRKCVADL